MGIDPSKQASCSGIRTSEHRDKDAVGDCTESEKSRGGSIEFNCQGCRVSKESWGSSSSCAFSPLSVTSSQGVVLLSYDLEAVSILGSSVGLCVESA